MLLSNLNDFSDEPIWNRRIAEAIKNELSRSCGQYIAPSPLSRRLARPFSSLNRSYERDFGVGIERDDMDRGAQILDDAWRCPAGFGDGSDLPQ